MFQERNKTKMIKKIIFKRSFRFQLPDCTKLLILPTTTAIAVTTTTATATAKTAHDIVHKIIGFYYICCLFNDIHHNWSHKINIVFADLLLLFAFRQAGFLFCSRSYIYGFMITLTFASLDSGSVIVKIYQHSESRLMLSLVNVNYQPLNVIIFQTSHLLVIIK